MKVSLLVSAALAAILVTGFTNCAKDESPSGTGKVSFEITDAPLDDSQIKGVFVTVAGVKVDGEGIDHFSGKQTIDLLAYQNGQVKALGFGNLQAGAYQNIRLVLDYETDASGVSPGCYVLTKDGGKHAVKAAVGASNEIQIGSGALDVAADGNATVVIDMDLRKAIRYGTVPAVSAYQFVTDAELGTATRLVVKSETGAIAGTCQDPLGVAGTKIVVYAYKKGTFTASEKLAQGSSGIKFKNAVTSAVCDDGGNFTLSFLEDGQYELHFVGYSDANGDGKLEEKGMLSLNVLGGLNLNALDVSATATVRLDVTVIAILPL